MYKEFHIGIIISVMMSLGIALFLVVTNTIGFETFVVETVTGLRQKLTTLNYLMKSFIQATKTVSDMTILKSYLNATKPDQTPATLTLYTNILGKNYDIPFSMKLEIDKERVEVLGALDAMLH